MIHLCRNFDTCSAYLREKGGVQNMRKRKNKKLCRRIELMVKMCVFIFGVYMVIHHFTDKISSQLTPDSSDIVPETNTITSPRTLISIQGLSQEGIPTGCEAVSTVALLQYLGIDIDVNTFIEDYLPCQDFYYINGDLYGADPHEAFAGNPYNKTSLGCFPKVILKALHQMKSDDYPNFENIEFDMVSGSSLDALANQYLSQSIPILLWITIDLKEPTPGMQYHLEDGSLYTWAKQEHCVVLCGYDEENYYFMDPLADGQIVTRNKELVELRYEQLGNYALIIKRN